LSLCKVGRSAGTWTARLVYSLDFVNGLRWYLYFVRHEHAAAFVERWH
jgi:hypothetical protein